MQHVKICLTQRSKNLQSRLLHRTNKRSTTFHRPSHKENSMFAIPEQFSAASKANIEAQVALLTSLSNKVFEGVEKIVDLNLNVVKASLEESNAAAKQILAAKDLQEVLSLTAAQVQPNAEKALAYGADRRNQPQGCRLY